MSHVPRFSIVTPVYGTPPEVLRAAVDSVLHQSFGDWQLCLVDDGSPPDTVQTLLAELAASDPRIEVHTRTANGGIVAASNDALAMARGEFVALFDHDDVLEPHALERVDEALRSDDEIDLVYTDADKIDPWGIPVHPFRKPDWAPERFRHQNYLIHLAVIRRSIVSDIGGFRSGFDGSQDYDLLLRASERARRIHHIPEILYHWRIIEGSAAGDVTAKPAAYTAGRRAVQEHCERVGIDAVVEPVERVPGCYRLRRPPGPARTVSVVIPTAGVRQTVRGVDTTLVLRALDGLLDATDHDGIEIVVVVDPATPERVVRHLRRRAARGVRLLPGTQPFNWSRASNLGARATSGELLLFLNDDVEVIHPDWLTNMVARCTGDVGVVGPMLVFEDGRVQSAGHCHVGVPEHIGRLDHADAPGAFGIFHIDRECSGVTGACLLTPRNLFEELGGMHEDLPNSYNDVYYCCAARELGHRVLWTPSARLRHHEQASRDPAAGGVEALAALDRWADDLLHDRYMPDGPREAPASARQRAAANLRLAATRDR
jgi:O-antigen biosynthesis protein